MLIIQLFIISHALAISNASLEIVSSNVSSFSKRGGDSLKLQGAFKAAINSGNSASFIGKNRDILKIGEFNDYFKKEFKNILSRAIIEEDINALKNLLSSEFSSALSGKDLLKFLCISKLKITNAIMSHPVTIKLISSFMLDEKTTTEAAELLQNEKFQSRFSKSFLPFFKEIMKNGDALLKQFLIKNSADLISTLPKSELKNLKSQLPNTIVKSVKHAMGSDVDFNHLNVVNGQVLALMTDSNIQKLQAKLNEKDVGLRIEEVSELDELDFVYDYFKNNDEDIHAILDIEISYYYAIPYVINTALAKKKGFIIKQLLSYPNLIDWKNENLIKKYVMTITEFMGAISDELTTTLKSNPANNRMATMLLDFLLIKSEDKLNGLPVKQLSDIIGETLLVSIEMDLIKYVDIILSNENWLESLKAVDRLECLAEFQKKSNIEGLWKLLDQETISYILKANPTSLHLETTNIGTLFSQGLKKTIFQNPSVLEDQQFIDKYSEFFRHVYFQAISEKDIAIITKLGNSKKFINAMDAESLLASLYLGSNTVRSKEVDMLIFSNINSLEALNNYAKDEKNVMISQIDTVDRISPNALSVFICNAVVQGKLELANELLLNPSIKGRFPLKVTFKILSLATPNSQMQKHLLLNPTVVDMIDCPELSKYVTIKENVLENKNLWGPLIIALVVSGKMNAAKIIMGQSSIVSLLDSKTRNIAAKQEKEDI